MNRFKKFNSTQQGMTLMELIAGLAILAAVIVGSLSLFNNASTSNASTQLVKDMAAVRSATQQFFMGQGTYGAASLNQALITASKIPSTMRVVGTTINTMNGGTLTVTGNTTNFTMTLTNVAPDLCANMITNSSVGWSSVKVGAGATLTTFPVTPTVATDAANCGGAGPFSITWTTIS